MRTAIIRVGTAGTGGFPVELFCDADGPAWRGAPRATAEIPASLSPPDPPAVAAAGAPVDAVHDWLLARPAAADPRSSEFAEIGVWLRGLLLRDAVGAAWNELTADYPGEVNGNEGIRLMLDLDRGSGLARLPWELTAGQGPLPLFADEANPCSRMHALRPAGAVAVAAAPARECYPLLRVLVVCGADPADAAVKVDEELENLRSAFHSLWGFVDLEELDRPSQQVLTARYAAIRPHVLHFIGHGRQQGPGIVLEIAANGSQPTWTWRSAGIGAVVTNAPPKLAILNTCRSSQPRQGGGWEIADAFTQARVPAVIGMQGDIEGAAAADFTRDLYAALVERCDLDVAVARARAALVLELGDDSPNPWLPCLTVSGPPNDVLPERYGISEQLAAAVETAKQFKRIRSFVNRTDARRLLWSGSGGQGGALVVHGGADVGKSGLVRWFLGIHALRGANVAYVDLASTHHRDSVSVLRAIVRELLASPVHQAANATALAGVVADLGGVAESEDAVPRKPIPDLFEALKVAFSTLPTPFVALDHVQDVDDAHWDAYVGPSLLDPFAQHTVPGHLIVAVSSDRLDRLTDQLQPPQTPHVELKPLKAGEYAETVGRFLRVSPRQLDPQRANNLRIAYDPGEDGQWSAKVFDLLQSAIDLYGR